MKLWPDPKNGLPILLSIILLAGLSARADDELLRRNQVIPSETSVLLLPPLDVTPDSAHMQAPRQWVIRHREEYEFITRQFKMLGEAMATKAADASPEIDLTVLSARTTGNLDLIAKRAGADWVVNIVVQEAKGNSSAGQDAFKVHTRVLLQIWDARRHKWLANGTYIGQASDAGSPVIAFKDSLNDAAKGCLANVLGSYPQVVSVLGENGLKDYLQGQSNPFVGDPKKPFSGL